MQKIALFCLLAIVFAVPASAQEQAPKPPASADEKILKLQQAIVDLVEMQDRQNKLFNQEIADSRHQEAQLREECAALKAKASILAIMTPASLTTEQRSNFSGLVQGEAGNRPPCCKPTYYAQACLTGESAPRKWRMDCWAGSGRDLEPLGVGASRVEGAGRDGRFVYRSGSTVMFTLLSNPERQLLVGCGKSVELIADRELPLA